MQDAESLSDGRVRFSTGTLYGALRRLLRDGWIRRVEASEHPALSDERNRKYYRITETGGRILENEIGRMSRLVSAATRRTAESGA